MYIDKNSLLAKEIVDKNNDNNFAIGHLKVTEKTTQATDGKMFIEIENPTVNDKDYVKNELENEKEPVYVNLNEVKKIEKLLPKNKEFPIVENAKIGTKQGKAKIFTTDLENNVEIEHRKPDIKYPKLENYYPDENDKVKEITLNVNLLEKLLKVVKKLSDDGHNGIKFSFYNKPIVKFEFKNKDTSNCKGILLPMKTKEEK